MPLALETRSGRSDFFLWVGGWPKGARAGNPSSPPPMSPTQQWPLRSRCPSPKWEQTLSLQGEGRQASRGSLTLMWDSSEERAPGRERWHVLPGWGGKDFLTQSPSFNTKGAHAPRPS